MQDEPPLIAVGTRVKQDRVQFVKGNWHKGNGTRRGTVISTDAKSFTVEWDTGSTSPRHYDATFLVEGAENQIKPDDRM